MSMMNNIVARRRLVDVVSRLVIMQPSGLINQRFGSIEHNNSTAFTPMRYTSSMPSSSTNISTNIPTSSRTIDPSSPLNDSFGRFHDYLRMSLVEKCNLRCVYCMPADGVTLSPKDALLTYEERIRTIKLFSDLGVRKIKFTGGEPLISKDLAELIAYTKGHTNISSVGITTNGLLLSQQLDKLYDAGLNAINVSLDTLIPERFEKISRRDGKTVARVLAAIYKAISKGMRVKVNVVLMRGVNHDEMKDFIAMAEQCPGALDVRFIELMPFDGNEWSPSKMMSYVEAIDYLKEHEGIELHRVPKQFEDKHDTTKWYRSKGISSSNSSSSNSNNINGSISSSSNSSSIEDLNMPGGRVGFITSMSSHFCGGCNRLRITADGKLKVCLFGNEDLSLRDAFRSGADDLEVTRRIRGTVTQKKFSLGGFDSAKDISEAKNRPMILIGG